MAVICPTILAADAASYKSEIEKVAPFAHRIQIDLSDGVFASHQTIKPSAVWWPAACRADIHLMFKQPLAAAQSLLEHRPHLLIIHAEAQGDFQLFTKACREQGTKVGVALLPETDPAVISPALEMIDHVLIFSGTLGSYGGHANLELLNKSSILKSQKPELEIGWDGGIDDQNVAQLVSGGVDVLNVGGYIQHAENPQAAFERLQRIADETGTT